MDSYNDQKMNNTIDAAAVYATAYGLEEFAKIRTGLYGLGVDPKLALAAYSFVVDQFFSEQVNHYSAMVPLINGLPPQARIALFKSLVVMVVDLGTDTLNPQTVLNYITSVGGANVALLLGSSYVADMISSVMM